MALQAARTELSLAPTWSLIKTAISTAPHKKAAQELAVSTVAAPYSRFPRRPDSFLVSNEPSSAGQLHLGPQQPLSRRAAQECSPRRKPWGKSARYPSPNGAKDWHR